MNKTEKLDIVILGGGLAASSLSVSLLKENPNIKIAIIEKAPHFHKKVGEATSDLAALFFRRLGIEDFLKTQIEKTGLRFWLQEKNEDQLSKCSEYSSPSIYSEANGFHFNRKDVDEYLLSLAGNLGAHIFRPAKVTHVEYSPLNSKVQIKMGVDSKVFKSKWIVDASGRTCYMAEKMGWKEIVPNHTTSACWGHFPIVPNFEEIDNMEDKDWPKDAIGPRRYTTSHLTGFGYWIWLIPLSDNTVSIGIVYDFEVLENSHINPKEFFLKMISENSILSKILTGVKMPQLYHINRLSYLSNKIYSPGLTLIGNAAGFIDPLFSPGMELIGQQVVNLKSLFLKEFETQKHESKKWMKYENTFLNAMRTRFYLYEKRYELMADQELFALQTQMDFAGYYNFHVIPSVAWPKVLKFPANFTLLLSKFYLFFRRRYLSANRFRREHHIFSEKQIITYSHASVPFGIMRWVKGPTLSTIWLFRHIRFEVKFLVQKWRAFRKRFHILKAQP